MKTTLSEQENALALRKVQQLRATFEEFWAIFKKFWSNLGLTLSPFRGPPGPLHFYIPVLGGKGFTDRNDRFLHPIIHLKSKKGTFPYRPL